MELNVVLVLKCSTTMNCDVIMMLYLSLPLYLSFHRYLSVQKWCRACIKCNILMDSIALALYRITRFNRAFAQLLRTYSPIYLSNGIYCYIFWRWLYIAEPEWMNEWNRARCRFILFENCLHLKLFYRCKCHWKMFLERESERGRARD